MQTQILVPDELQVGERLLLKMHGQSLGLGIHVWNGLILLDTGKVVRQERCSWDPIAPDPVPPFTFYLNKAVRAFHRTGNSLFYGQTMLGAKQNVTIEEIRTLGWNHGRYLAGRFQDRRERPHWVLISDLDLPEVKVPYLQVVQ